MIRGPSRAAGIEFTGDAEDFVFDLAGPHPFFLQIACFHAFELLQSYPAFGEEGCRQLEEQVQVDLKPHFEYFTRRLSEEEWRILACLLDTEQGKSSTAILRDLERKCLVRQRNGRCIPVSRAFAHFVRQEIGTSWAATVAEGDRRMATVLFADVVGFTPMSEQHIPEEILSIMKPALRMFVDVVDRHKGKVANFGGDSILALFGIATDNGVIIGTYLRQSFGERRPDSRAAIRAAAQPTIACHDDISTIRPGSTPARANHCCMRRR